MTGCSLLLGLKALVTMRSRTARHCRDEIYPFYMRNMAFAIIPFGCMAILYGLTGISYNTRHDDLMVAAALAAFFFFLVGVAFMLEPPNWVKPRWIRQRERLRTRADIQRR